MKNPFEVYVPKTRTIKVKALGGAEVKVRPLTLEESIAFQREMVKGVGPDGKPILNADKIYDVRLERVAAVLVEPKMTIDDLKKLSAEAMDAIVEIDDAIREKGTDDSGN